LNWNIKIVTCREKILFVFVELNEIIEEIDQVNYVNLKMNIFYLGDCFSGFVRQAVSKRRRTYKIAMTQC